MNAGVLILCAGVIAQVAAQAPTPPATLTVEQAVAEALDKNLDLAAERARLPVADALRTSAALRPNPVFSVSTDHLDLVGPRFTESNGGGPAEISFRSDVAWEQGGKRRRRIAVADSDRLVTRQEVADQGRQLAFEVQSTFIDLLLAQRTLALGRENLSAMQRVRDIARARVSSGDLAEVELMRTRVAVLQLENEVRQQELAIRMAQRRLALLLGRPSDAPPIEAAGDFQYLDRVPPTDDLVRLAVAQRPDLLALAAERDRAEADILLQRSLGRADITLGTEYRRQQGVNGKSNSLGFFISTPLQLFDRNQGEVARARAAAVEAARRLEARQATVAAEVEQAWDQHQAARALLLRIDQEMLADAREVRAIAEYSYERGEATLVELLDAQRAFNDTMQSHLSARAELARSLYLIDAVSGKGVTR